VRFKRQGYDWYAVEKKKASSLEKGKRIAARNTFLTTISREIRRGGRMFMVAELADEQFPGGRLTVVNAHLEDKAKPASRVAQLRELLTYAKSIDGPLVIGGDMNTTGSDSTPTSITREITRRFGSAEYWAKKSVMDASGVGVHHVRIDFLSQCG
jgi:endonuclease/exonuclease/phosphatase family metal-dependent hydrolase